MAKPSDVLAEAGKLRDLANRARRLAAGLTQPSDRDRLQHYASELEQRTAELEQQAGSARPRPVTQDQQQVQQQQQAEPPAKDKE